MTDLNLTVHWHGLTQKTAPFSDGSPQVSQWPIPPLHFFDYEIRPDIGDAGSYFYHSHVGFQAITATGALIVDGCERTPYHYDDEKIIQLTDYYNKTDTTIEEGLLANPFVWSGETNALVLNGKSGTKAYNETTVDSTCAPAIIKVKPGLAYRFRWIGSTAISLITLGIEDHPNMTIIEADGHFTQPFESDHLQVASGQRFSTLFQAKSLSEIRSTNKTTYWLQMENRERPANVTGYALLIYDLPNEKDAITISNVVPSTLPSPKPLTLPQTINNWLEYSLQPHSRSHTPPFPPLSSVTRTIYITVKQRINGTYRWEQDGNIWQAELIETPYLISIYSSPTTTPTPNYTAALLNPLGAWDPTTLVFPALLNETLDIVWLNSNGPSGGWDIHPFHAHGGHYFDLGSGNGTYDPVSNEERFKTYTPVLRDTTMLYRYAASGSPNTTAGWRAWRVQVDNPGVWMMHCHILAHMTMGMSTIWSFGDVDDIRKAAVDDQGYLPNGYLTYGGNAYGNESWDPLVWEYGS
ncbi:putative l-ascorbate oxidase [Phaeomoniella chlamydospora]|uniref:Putative l-ascorbate oxidase n=1 Tax=Phaeomoniella chlamydospora TaxID=158046 RepID=A0A0G2E5F8_PHACM|nr:putative l-ascorbate oxidase [Phaeomoniella chlamydospora]